MVIPHIRSCRRKRSTYGWTRYSRKYFSKVGGTHNSPILPFFVLIVISSTRIFGTDGEVSGNRAVNFDKAYSNTRNFGNPSQIIDFPNWDAVVSAFPVLAHPSHSDGKAGFRGLFNGNAGWVKSMEAMAIVKRECESLGVKFETGVHGTVVELLRRGSESEIVTGVKTEDGKEWAAEKVVLAAGSYSDTLLDFEGQLIAVILQYIPMGSPVLKSSPDWILRFPRKNDRRAIPTLQAHPRY